ncbi:MAG: segregation/condensation protein A [Blastocatellia bacterium]|nr:segregation/condensation protein A [Blastocatellia bacterium]
MNETFLSASVTQGLEPPVGDNPDQYRVRLEIFEGPLDLLLYLIRKEEVSIYDIPIARITEQYLEYLRAMQELDIGVAGEFLVMAATLIHIKSQMLLPRDPDAPDQEMEDPRKELVYQLLEHQKFKAAANALHQRATIEGGVFTRAALESDDDNPEIAATAFQLFEIFQEILARRRAITEIEIARDEMTMAEKIGEIKAMVAEKGQVQARDLFERAGSRRELVLIFLAVLELVKELAIRLVQKKTFGEILLVMREGSRGAGEQGSKGAEERGSRGERY